jgi:hypothetical protein
VRYPDSDKRNRLKTFSPISIFHREGNVERSKNVLAGCLDTQDHKTEENTAEQGIREEIFKTDILYL